MYRPALLRRSDGDDHDGARVQADEFDCRRWLSIVRVLATRVGRDSIRGWFSFSSSR